MNDSTKPDRLEPLVRVDIIGLRAAEEFSVMAAFQRGFDVGQQHCVIAEEHISQHGLHTSDPFWLLLGEKATAALDTGNAPEDGIAFSAYQVLRAKFMQAFTEANSLEALAASHEAQAERIDAVKEQYQFQYGPDVEVEIVTEEMLGGPDGERIIDEIAKGEGHEHMTREDECDFIQFLRAQRQHMLDHHSDEGGAQ